MAEVSKIYELKTLGYEQITKQLETIAQKFEAIKTAKQGAEGASKAENAKAASDALNQEKVAAAQLRTEQAKLRVEAQRLSNETKVLTLASKQQAAASKAAKAANTAEAGSITAVRQQMKELNKAITDRAVGGSVAFRGQTLQYDQAIRKLQELSKVSQDYSRQFARDGLLVGEYTSGIVQAFKRVGLDDIIGNQVQKANSKLEELNREFDKLQQELKESGDAGKQGLSDIERQLIENRKEALSLSAQVGKLQEDFRGVGNIGDRVTNNIKQGFKDLKGSVVQFTIGVVGVQAVFNKLVNEAQEGLRDAAQFEGVEAAFARLNQPGLLDNLRAATKGTVSDLELMKQAVQASNFEIPLESLGSLLEFARRRAKDTGQEVDFLVQSIITGIGRKSPLILDNLGISAVRLKENLGGVTAESASIGDVATAVARIITEENAKAGKEIDTNSETLAQNRAQWENLRTELTGKLLPVLAAVGTVLTTVVGILAGIPFPILIGGIVAATSALALYKAEQIRAYVATQVATKQGLIYNAFLIAQAAYTRAAALATKIATAEIVLFNGAIRFSPIGIFLTVLGLLVPTIAAFAANTKAAKAEMNALNDVQQQANSIYAEQVGKIDALKAIITSTATSIDTKKKALQELIAIDPAFRSALDGQTISLAKLEQAYRQVTAAIRTKANAEASAKLSAEKNASVVATTTLRQRIEQEAALNPNAGAVSLALTEEERALANTVLGGSIRNNGNGGIVFSRNDFTEVIGKLRAEEEKRIQTYQSYLSVQTKAQQQLDALTANANAGTQQQFEVDLKALQDRKKSLDDQINEFQGTQAALKALIAERSKVQADLDKLTGSGTGSNASGSGGRGTQAVKDPVDLGLAILDENQRQQKALLDASRAENEIDDIKYYEKLLELQDEYFDQKLLLYLKNKPKELDAIREIKADQIVVEAETNAQLLQARQKALEEQLQQSIRNAEQIRDAIVNDPNASPTQIAEARVTAGEAMLQAQISFNTEMDALEKAFNVVSKTNAQQRADNILAIDRQLNADRREVTVAGLQELQDASAAAIAKAQAEFALLRQKAASSNLRPRGRERAIAGINAAEQRNILALEVQGLTQQLPLFERLYEQKKITEAEYFTFKKDLADKAAQLESDVTAGITQNVNETVTLATLLRDAIKNAFKIDSGNAQLDRLIGDTIAQSFNLARTAMEGYFDAESQRINQSRDAAIERLELERDQRLNLAQSKEEELAIEKEFAYQKEQEDRKAFEKQKKMQRAQAGINLATQLSNLAVIAFAPNPANILTLGAAGAIMYAIQAGIALAGYAANIGRINAQQFEYGGQVPTDTGGKIEGPSHAAGGVPFNYEAEGGELAIIRTKNRPSGRSYTISGNHNQIASALNQLGGGRAFAPGASISRFEYGGSLGESLQPPVFTPAAPVGQASSGSMQLAEAIGELSEEIRYNNRAINERIDRIEVVQVTSSVTRAQQKEAKQKAIGVL